MNKYSTRIVYMGTPEFAVAPLKGLHESGVEIAAVVTAPDKPAGRGKKIKESAVKQYAVEHLDCPILQPTNLKDPDLAKNLSSLDAEMFIVVAFRMLPEAIWSIPSKGTINLHASMLPQYRGAAPINWAIINGEKETGVTTFIIDEKIDTGRVLLQSRVDIDPDDNVGSLHDKLMFAGSELLVKTVRHVSSDNIVPVDQSDFPLRKEDLKSAPKIFKEDCRINWEENTETIRNKVRGFSPVPGAFTEIEKDETVLQLKIFQCKASDASALETGTVLSDNKTFLKIACKDGCLEIDELQLQGKKRMSASDFLRGFQDDLNDYSCK